MNLSCDVLVIGAGASGVSAAIQAARLGANVVLTEEHDWPGGMLTAAGVSCIDGNHDLPSGIFGELRRRLEQHYGGADKLATGWVSHTCFEPSVARTILSEMIADQKNLQFRQPVRFDAVLKKEGGVRGARFVSADGELDIEAKVTIDATELGDVLAAAGCAYSVGRDARETFNEKGAPKTADDIIQDLTWVAILKDYGKGADKTIVRPAGYDPELFRGCCAEFASPGDKNNPPTAEKMLSYGRLPNNKTMINWPIRGNDFYVNVAEADEHARKDAFEQAKIRTLQFVYFIQHQLGFKNRGIADDEFPTADGLALIPYHREGRRLQGAVTLTANHLAEPYAAESRHLLNQAIAVGNYPLDHHHDRGPLKEKEDLAQIKAFYVPFGALLPKETDGLLVAEKAISVSHLANGATRLQPVAMGIGQAAGAAAALCAKKNIPVRQTDVRAVQQSLLEAGCWLVPLTDIKANDWFFYAVQRLAVCGIMGGEAKTENWANHYNFYPQAELTLQEMQQILDKLAEKNIISSFALKPKATPVTRVDALTLLLSAQIKSRQEADKTGKRPLHFLEGNNGKMHKPITRAEFAFLVDSIFEPFSILTAELP